MSPTRRRATAAQRQQLAPAGKATRRGTHAPGKPRITPRQLKCASRARADAGATRRLSAPGLDRLGSRADRAGYAAPRKSSRSCAATHGATMRHPTPTRRAPQVGDGDRGRGPRLVSGRARRRAGHEAKAHAKRAHADATDAKLGLAQRLPQQRLAFCGRRRGGRRGHPDEDTRSAVSVPPTGARGPMPVPQGSATGTGVPGSIAPSLVKVPTGDDARMDEARLMRRSTRTTAPIPRAASASSCRNTFQLQDYTCGVSALMAICATTAWDRRRSGTRDRHGSSREGTDPVHIKAAPGSTGEVSRVPKDEGGTFEPACGWSGPS